MAIVVPTVCASSTEEYAAMLKRAETVSPRVHVDVGDGEFAPGGTLDINRVFIEEAVQLDLHLMVREPLKHLNTALSLKPDLIIIHAESSGDLHKVIVNCQNLGIRVGLAILPETPIDSVAGLIEQSDHVLLFTGTLGKNAGVFHEETLMSVAKMRSIKTSLEVSVDGGVNDQNAGVVASHGVDVLYVGSYLQYAEDPKNAYKTLVRQIEVVS